MIFINFTSFFLSTVLLDEESVKFMDEDKEYLTFKETTPRLLQLKLHYFVLVAAGSLVFFVLTRFCFCFRSHLLVVHCELFQISSVHRELVHIC